MQQLDPPHVWGFHNRPVGTIVQRKRGETRGRARERLTGIRLPLRPSLGCKGNPFLFPLFCQPLRRLPWQQGVYCADCWQTNSNRRMTCAYSNVYLYASTVALCECERARPHRQAVVRYKHWKRNLHGNRIITEMTVERGRTLSLSDATVSSCGTGTMSRLPPIVKHYDP